MKKLWSRVIRVLIFCTLLAANWLALLPGSTTVFAKPADRRPGGLAHSQVIDPPIFKQDTGNGCDNSSKDFDPTSRTDPGFHNGMAHYHVLTINDDGPQCDHLSWDVHATVPQAAMNTCRFFMQLAGIDSNTGLGFKFLDNNNNVITTLQDLAAPPVDEFTDVKGVHVVQADLSRYDAETQIDVGTLFVDCNSADLRAPTP